MQPAPAGYMKAPYETKRLFNLAFFEEIVVKDRAIAKTQYQVPFCQLLGAQQGKNVLNKELSRFGTRVSKWLR